MKLWKRPSWQGSNMCQQQVCTGVTEKVGAFWATAANGSGERVGRRGMVYILYSTYVPLCVALQHSVCFSVP